MTEEAPRTSADLDALLAEYTHRGEHLGKAAGSHARSARSDGVPVERDPDAHSVQRHGEALQKSLDPDHSPPGVAKQLGAPQGGRYPMDGFVRAWVESRNPADNIGEDLWMVPMGYYTGKDLPTYDFWTLLQTDPKDLTQRLSTARNPG